jgi:hypothetical protein
MTAPRQSSSISPGKEDFNATSNKRCLASEGGEATIFPGTTRYMEKSSEQSETPTQNGVDDICPSDYTHPQRKSEKQGSCFRKGRDHESD